MLSCSPQLEPLIQHLIYSDFLSSKKLCFPTYFLCKRFKLNPQSEHPWMPAYNSKSESRAAFYFKGTEQTKWTTYDLHLFSAMYTHRSICICAFLCFGLHCVSSFAELQVLLDSSLESAEICANEAVPSCGKLKCRSHPKHEGLCAFALTKQPKT